MISAPGVPPPGAVLIPGWHSAEVFLGKMERDGFRASEFVDEMKDAFEDMAGLEITEPREPMSIEEMLAAATVSGDEALERDDGPHG